jgi:hypothetical protein
LISMLSAQTRRGQKRMLPESAVAALRHDFDRCALPPRKRAMKSKERRAGAAPSSEPSI